jgi:hypothetical protein
MVDEKFSQGHREKGQEQPTCSVKMNYYCLYLLKR